MSIGVLVFIPYAFLAVIWLFFYLAEYSWHADSQKKRTYNAR